MGGMRTGEVAGTGHLERIVLNDRGEGLRRESLLTTLHREFVMSGRDRMVCFLF